ncbi:putative Gonadotropin-releasing hormone receptor [Hypsibius exemplaris]|uniref:Gonadotropin-releasing hormone receptor n=1 Tax=Hypsibius exemplaris TaxID=2072580 RepID=A0A1W0W999_HYPEX|nr:putative Gonadotropin-releasing hormone receptor [Hypsibius exemplaris]
MDLDGGLDVLLGVGPGEASYTLSSGEAWIKETSSNISALFDGDFMHIPPRDAAAGHIDPANFTGIVMGLEENALEQAHRFFQVYVLFALAALGFVGNVVIIVVLVTKRAKERCFTNINFLILQLAISDLMVVAFCLFADAIWKATYRWLAGDFVCRFVKYFQMLSLYASTFIIVTISMDRCIAILCPISRFDHHRLMKLITLSAWVLAALCSIPQLIIFSVQKAPFPINGIQDFRQCVTHGAYSADWQEPAYVVFTFCVMFAVPLLIIVPNYCLIFAKIAKESKMITGGVTDQSQQQLQRKRSSSTRLNSGSFSAAQKRELLMKRAKAKALCISILVIVTFIVCWAPYYVCMIYYVIINKDPGDPSAHYMFQIIFFFGMSNSVLNPGIYGAFHMARRSQSAWRKWHRGPCASTTANFLHAAESSMSRDQFHGRSLDRKLSTMCILPGYYSSMRDSSGRRSQPVCSPCNSNGIILNGHVNGHLPMERLHPWLSGRTSLL